MRLVKKAGRYFIKIIIVPIGFVWAWTAMKEAYMLFMGKGRWEALLFLAVWTWVFAIGIRNLWMPKYSKSMKVLRGLISYREVKTLLKSEMFHPVNIPLINRYTLPSIKASDSWICIDGVFIPREMCMGLIWSQMHLMSDHYQISLITSKGDELYLGKIEQKNINIFLEVLKKELPELNINPSGRWRNKSS